MAKLPEQSTGVGVGWAPQGEPPVFESADLARAAERFREEAHVIQECGSRRVGVGWGGAQGRAEAYRLLGTLPPLHPEWLGDRSFAEAHGLRFAYCVGEMANGIATVAMVEAAARAGLLGFFGAAGLSLERVQQAVAQLQERLGPSAPWGVNLIHAPSEPDHEEAVADLLLRSGVARISASAYLRLTPAVVRCAVSGLSVDGRGRVRRSRRLFAKVSRLEVARHFLAPAPVELLRALRQRGQITETEAALAERVPLVEDLTVEADSGGHTDNRPLVAMFPAFLQLRDQLAASYGHEVRVRVGAAGGLGTPGAVAAAYALGAAYVVTGSVNQAAVESGLSEAGRKLLAQAELADVAMAPAADMFELGVKVQVLKRGSMFASRAQRLYELYQAHAGLEDLPPAARARLEAELFRAPLAQAWEETRAFWARRDPREVARAEADPKHRMALVFRSYLGRASRWAIEGEPSRAADYQIWCGPAMGAFNAWTKGSFLEEPGQRTTVQIARNLLEGAAVITRAHQLRTYGAPVPHEAFNWRPRRLE